MAIYQDDFLDSSDDYFCDQKTEKLESDSLSLQDPAYILEFFEELEANHYPEDTSELFHGQ